MTQVQLIKIQLKEGKEHLWLDWCEELKQREAEVIETLENEGVLSESCFVSENEKCIYYFMEAESFDQVADAALKSIFKIDADHKAVKIQCLE